MFVARQAIANRHPSTLNEAGPPNSVTTGVVLLAASVTVRLVTNRGGPFFVRIITEHSLQMFARVHRIHDFAICQIPSRARPPTFFSFDHPLGYATYVTLTTDVVAGASDSRFKALIRRGR